MSVNIANACRELGYTGTLTTRAFRGGTGAGTLGVDSPFAVIVVIGFTPAVNRIPSPNSSRHHHRSPETLALDRQSRQVSIERLSPRALSGIPGNRITIFDLGSNHNDRLMVKPQGTHAAENEACNDGPLH